MYDVQKPESKRARIGNWKVLLGYSVISVLITFLWTVSTRKVLRFFGGFDDSCLKIILLSRTCNLMWHMTFDEEALECSRIAMYDQLIFDGFIN